MVKDKLKREIEKIVGTAVKLEHPQDPQHGDYSTNVAAGKPFEFAQKLAEKLRQILITPAGPIAKIDVVRPGFINFWLAKEEFSRQVNRALKEAEKFGRSSEGKGKTVIIEYSSPNIAKRFGIGHLRSTIIGQAIYNLYKFQGYKTINENFLGDWGTQFGAILYQITNYQLPITNLSVDKLEELYVEFNKAAQDKPELWDQARMWFKKLEDGDKEARKIWQACVDVSLAEFNRIYDALGVKFENMHPESFFQDKMGEVIEAAKKKNLAVQDQGAWIIRVPGIKTPLILLKSDGATTYETRDLAAIKWRVGKWQPDLIIYEVGAEQTLHFRLVFGAAELLGYGKMNQFVHVKHGLYLSPSGQKFATRYGETVKLEEILEEAIERARKLVNRSKSDLRITNDELRPEEKERIARAVGIGAVKYFDLAHSPQSNIIFSWEKMFKLTGNSAPYLQYTYARTQSVLRRAGITKHQAPSTSYSSNPEELALLRTFYKFPEVVSDAAAQFAPNLVCNFLFDLAQKYNAFYNQHRIIGSPTRLALNEVTGNILKTGLNLLGIAAPQRM